MDDHLDGQGEEVDLLQRLDLAVLDQAAQLGNGHPFLEAQYLNIYKTMVLDSPPHFKSRTKQPH